MTTIFNVTNANDSGAGSFRQAITDLNLSVAIANVIQFSAPFNIVLASALPVITNRVTMNCVGSTLTRNVAVDILNINIVAANQTVAINDLELNSLVTINNEMTCIRCNNTSLYLINVKIIGINYIRPSAITALFGFGIHITGGSLGIVSNVEYGTRYANNSMTVNFGISATNRGFIYASNCPIFFDDINTTIFESNSITFGTNSELHGVFINTDSELTMSRVQISDNYTSAGGSTNSLVSLITTRADINVTLLNFTITNNGNSVVRLASGVVNLSNNAKLVAIDFVFNNDNALCFNVVGPESTVTMLSNSRTSTFSGTNSGVLNAHQSANIRIGGNGNPINVTEMNGASYIPGLSSGFQLNECPLIEFNDCNFTNSDGGISANDNKGIHITNGSVATITNCTFDNLICNGPQLIVVNVASRSNLITLTDNTFTNCTNNGTVFYGGAMHVRGRNTVVHSGNSISNCTSQYGGGIYFAECNVSGDTSRTEIYECSSSVSGGAIYFDRSYVETGDVFNGFDLINNQSVNGGAISFTSNSLPIVSEITCINNTATTNGGAIYSECAGTLLINASRNIILSNNSSPNGRYLYCIGTVVEINGIEMVLSSNNMVSLPLDRGSLVVSNSRVNIINATINVDALNHVACSNMIESQITYSINSIINSIDICAILSNAIDANYLALSNVGGIGNTGMYSEIDLLINGNTIKGFSYGVRANGTNRYYNSTLTENEYGISNSGACEIANCTITRNIIGLENNSSSVLIANSIIAFNDVFNVSVVGGVVTSLGNNASNENESFFIGSDIVNSDLGLNILADNGGICETIGLMNGSVCINAGNNSYAPTSYDNRGFGYNRIVDGIVDIGAFENQNPVICFVGNSKLLMENNEWVSAKDIKSGDKITIINNESNNNNLSAPIIHNVVSGKKEWFVKIIKDQLGNGIPFEDTYFTGGHMLVVNGVEIKARDLEEKGYGQKIKLDKQYVHSIVVKDRSIINVNGITNIAFGKEEWDTYSNKCNIQWKDNKQTKEE